MLSRTRIQQQRRPRIDRWRPTLLLPDELGPRVRADAEQPCQRVVALGDDGVVRAQVHVALVPLCGREKLLVTGLVPFRWLLPARLVSFEMRVCIILGAQSMCDEKLPSKDPPLPPSLPPPLIPLSVCVFVIPGKETPSLNLVVSILRSESTCPRVRALARLLCLTSAESPKRREIPIPGNAARSRGMNNVATSHVKMVQIYAYTQDIQKFRLHNAVNYMVQFMHNA